MSNASAGARIKAWAGPGVGSGIVRNITFKNFVVSQVVLPITIDQVSPFVRNAIVTVPYLANIVLLYQRNGLCGIPVQYVHRGRVVHQVCRVIYLSVSKLTTLQCDWDIDKGHCRFAPLFT